MKITQHYSFDHCNDGRPARQGRKSPRSPVFEPGTALPGGGFLFVKNPDSKQLSLIRDMAASEISAGVASLEVVQSVYRHNPLSFWAFMRSTDESRSDAELVGFCAFLPLNSEGLAALRSGVLDAGTPNLGHLAGRAETPVALYIWAIVARGTADLGGKLMGHAIGLDLYERLPMFGTVGTESGRRSLEKRRNSPQSETATIGSFFEVRHPKMFLEEMRGLDICSGRRPRAGVDRSELQVVLASTANDIAKVFAIRAAVFLAEQDCPYDEEFDGNDYAGGHILGLVNGEAAAVLRVRYFADFVKLERLAVLPRFRRTLIAKLVVEHAIEICRRKGYRRMYGHAQKRLVSLWERFGFVAMNKNTPLVFSDHEYVEMLGSIAPHDAPLTPYSDPYMLIRPEGRWDVPGVLDKSSDRRATNPQQDRRFAVSA